MATKNTSLAVKYRPQSFEDVCGQDVVKQILKHQIDTGTFKQGYLFAGIHGGGKALPMNAHILGPDGYFKMRDAKVGMKVWGEDGQLHTIVGVFPQGVKEMYRIHFSDKTYADCCIDHLWTMRKHTCSITRGPHQWFTQSVRWLLQQDLWTAPSVDDKGHKNNSHKYRIPVTQPLNFPQADLPIDSYLLGQLISDGSISEKAGTLGITISDEDVKVQVNKLLNNIGLELAQLSNITSDNKFDYYIRNVSGGNNIAKLKSDLDLMDLRKTARFKHIPKEYLFSSIDQRIRLLQGLFDGDGSVQDGQYTYSTSSSELRDDITFLIQSLGGIVNVREGKQSFRVAENGDRIYYGDSFEFIFHLPRSIKPFTSAKHRNRYGKGSLFDRVDMYKFIDHIEKLPDSECQCIMTDNPTGLFLMNDCIVTHNTTCARIFAKMINGSSNDIIEVDAATYNSVDRIREISEEAKRKPLVGKYKVFIIDEAHMLSSAAANAFLKLLEEPPATAIFVLATTDPQKIISTILSRVQRYDFTAISIDLIADRLKWISEQEGISIDDQSVRFIAKLGNGSMRDAISLLDKVHSVSDKITLPQVTSALAVVSYHDHLDLLKALIDKDVKKAVEVVCKVADAGKDMKQFINQFMWCVCDVCNQFIFNSYDYINIPELPEYTSKISCMKLEQCLPILDWAKHICSDIRNDTNPKNTILVEVMLWTQR